MKQFFIFYLQFHLIFFLNIYIDNTTAIKNLEQSITLKLIQTKNWNIIFYINHLKHFKNILTTFHKVKLYSTDSFHNQADSLAKQGTTKSIIKLNILKFNTPNHFLWNNFLISFKVRTFIKNIITIQEIAKWSNLKFFQNITNIKWSLIFKTISSLEDNLQKYSFRIKILTNNLPTMQNLNICYPYLYTTSNCSRCTNTEDVLHLFLCSSNTTNISQSLENIIHNTLLSFQITNITSTTLLNILLKFTLYSSNPQYKYILHAITGTYSLSIYDNIKTLINKQTDSFLLHLSNNLLTWFHQDLWSIRNIYQHQWELSRNITSKSKRTKISLPTLSNPSNNIITSSQFINTNSLITKWLLQGHSLTTCII